MIYIIASIHHKSSFGIGVGTILSYLIGPIYILTDPYGPGTDGNPGTLGDGDDYYAVMFICMFCRLLKVCFILPDENYENVIVKGVFKKLIKEFPLISTCSQTQASLMQLKYVNLLFIASPIFNCDLLTNVVNALKNKQIAVIACQGFKEAYNMATTKQEQEDSKIFQDFLSYFNQFYVFSTKATMIQLEIKLVTTKLPDLISTLMLLKLCLLMDPNLEFAPGVWNKKYGSGSSSATLTALMNGIDTSSISIPDKLTSAKQKYIVKLLKNASKNPKIEDIGEFETLMNEELHQVLYFIVTTFENPLLVLTEDGAFHTLRSLTTIMKLTDNAPKPQVTPYLYDMVMAYVLFAHTLNIWEAFLVFFRLKKYQTTEEYVQTAAFKKNFLIMFNMVNDVLRRMLE